MAYFAFAKTIMKSLFKKPSTNMYPIKPQVYKARTRGHIDIDIDKCIFCSICMKKCPTAAIEVNKDTKNWGIERLRCIQCNSCVEVCPKQCLAMKNEYTPPSSGKVKDEFFARTADNTADNQDSE